MNEVEEQALYHIDWQAESLGGYRALARAALNRRVKKVLTQSEGEALALLRELNDALVIPGWLQPRVDAVLDRAEEP